MLCCVVLCCVCVGGLPISFIFIAVISLRILVVFDSVLIYKSIYKKGPLEDLGAWVEIASTCLSLGWVPIARKCNSSQAAQPWITKLKVLCKGRNTWQCRKRWNVNTVVEGCGYFIGGERGNSPSKPLNVNM